MQTTCFGLLFIFLIYLHQSKAAPSANLKSYKGHQVVQIDPRNEDDVNMLKALQKKRLRLEFWTQPMKADNPVNVMVHPEHQQMFHLLLKTNGMNYHVSVPDVEGAISGQTELSARPSEENGFDFSRYHTMEEIYEWLSEIQSRRSDLVSLVDLGKSWQDRPIIAVKISSPNEQGPKKAVWLDAGIHANEWIGPATLLYFINQLISGYDTNGEIRWLVDNLDWYILPVFNPDGYIYTWTTDRLWRKNRADYHEQPECKGVDMNRNWDFLWGEGESDTDPCGRMYIGPSAFSEPEVKAVASFLASHNSSILLYAAYHSFSQLWMLPYSYSDVDVPPNLDELVNVSRRAVAVLKSVHGTEYHIGSVSKLVGKTAGASLDYTYGTLKIPYSFGIELRDTGFHGTLLPPDQIIPNCEESWAAIKEVAHHIIDKLHQISIPQNEQAAR